MRLLDELFAAGWGKGRRAGGEVGARTGRRGRRTRANRQPRFESLESRAMLAVFAGDIAVVMYNADGSPDSIAFVALTDIAGNEEIKFTDNGWLAAGGFRAGETVQVYTAPAEGLPAGSVVEVAFASSLSGSGDQIIAYQGDTSVVAALNNEGAGVWQADAMSTNTSALPAGLVNGTTAVALDEVDNARYSGTLSGTQAELLAAIHDKANWAVSDSTVFAWDRGSFSVTPSTDPTVTAPAAASDLATIEGSASASVPVAVAGSNLTEGILVTASAGFEVSLDDATFAASVTVPQTGGSASGTLHVRIAPSAGVGRLAGSLTLSTAGTADRTVALGGAVRPASIGLPYALQDFENGESLPWLTYSSAGNRDWRFVSSTFGNGSTSGGSPNRVWEANGFGGDVAARDWLMIGPFDFSGAANPVAEFTTLTRFTAATDELFFRYSTDYSGSGDPALATWTTVEFTRASSELIKTPSGQALLAGAAGAEEVFLAFEHVAVGTTGTALWQVDDFEVYESQTLSLSIAGVPATLDEGRYDVRGTVSIPTAIATDLTVTLTSSDAASLVLDNGDLNQAGSVVVTIFAGETTAEFFMEALEDFAVDPDTAVTITASVGDSSYDPATASVTVVNLDVPPAAFTAAGYTQDFAGFAAATPSLPAGWSGRGLVTTFPSSGNAWGEGFSAGYRGGASVFGYQHTGSTSTTASPNFEQVLALRNDTGSPITELSVAYTGRAARVDDASATRNPAYTVRVAGSTVAALAYSTADGDNAGRVVSLSGLTIAPGETFQVVWSSDRGAGSGGSRQIGISDVSVTLGSVQSSPTVSGLSIPTLTLGRQTAEVFATVPYDGGSPLSATGFVYVASTALTGELTLATPGAVVVTESFAGVGQIAETLAGLTAGTEYTIRAYATNAVGTSYTGATTFTTVSPAASFAGLYTQDFASYQGVFPIGWAAGTSNGLNSYLGEWGLGSAAGFLGVGPTETAGVLGYQHTATSGQLTVTLTLVNDTGSAITALDVGYLGRVARETQGRTPEWTVSVAGSPVAALAYSTATPAGEADPADRALQASLTGLSIAAGADFTVTWTSTSESAAGGQTGASRQIGIGDVVLSLPGVSRPSITASSGAASDALRIVTYNIAASQGSGQPRSGLDTILAAISSETYAGRTDRIDVLALQEVQSQATTTAAVVSQLNSLYGAGTYGRGTLDGTGQYTVGVVYDTASLTLVEEVAVTTGGPRQTIRYRFEPVTGSAADGFYLYNSHLKAQSDSTSEATRAAEAAAIRADADALGDGVSILYVGDFNLYTSSEQAFQTFVGAGAGQAFDPINSPGSWSSNSSFRGIFTQAPTLAGAGELVGGGLDDRFDFQLVSGEVLDSTGFDYLAGSYRAFGNNGSVPLNGDINDSGNTALAGLANRTEVLSLLTTVSDHLPVVADYTMPTSPGLTALATTVGTASAAGSFTVSAADLAGDLTIAAPAGFELSLSEATGFTTDGLVLTPVAGTVAATPVYIRLSASAVAGSYSGSVSVASVDARTQRLAIPTSTVAPAEGTVLDVADGQETTDSVVRGGQDRIVKRGRGRLVLDRANAHSGGTVVEDGEVIVRNPAALGNGTLDVRGNAVARFETGTATVSVTGLELAAGGRIDLDAGGLSIAAGGISAADLRAAIIAGRGAGGWNGAGGITSARAAQNPGGRSVGYVVAQDGSARVAFAAPGDSNLDGVVNFSDIQAIINGGRFGQAGSTGVWNAGDYNYDGVVNFSDIQLLLNAGAYGQPSYLPAQGASSGQVAAGGPVGGASLTGGVLATGAASGEAAAAGTLSAAATDAGPTTGATSGSTTGSGPSPASTMAFAQLAAFTAWEAAAEADEEGDQPENI